MTTPLTGRHALVCGASRGIGRAAAIALHELGASVTLLARSEDALRALADTLGGDTRFVCADLDDRPSLAARIDALLADAGPVHVLVHNTGGPPGGRLLDATEDALAAAFHRHVLSAHLLVRRVLPGMAAAGFGRIVNVISTSVYEPIPNLGVSNTTRAAMAGWAKTIAGELPPGVTINNVLPGFTNTDRLRELMTETAARRGVPVATIEAEWRAQTPEGRLADPAEIAAAIAFLASPAASFVRGVSLSVDGGRLRSI